jgi:hypothetical protein
MSSSAHTDGINSNSEKVESDSEIVSTISIKNYKNRKVLSESVNTSDINMISVDS